MLPNEKAEPVEVGITNLIIKEFAPVVVGPLALLLEKVVTPALAVPNGTTKAHNRTILRPMGQILFGHWLRYLLLRYLFLGVSKRQKP